MKLIRLRIELYDNDLNEYEKYALKKYLKSESDNSLIRDVIVPSDMMLNNLHYVIQKLFNFFAYHLRTFHLKEEDLKRITNNQFIKWHELVGTVFQAPGIADKDLFWNDEGSDDLSYNRYLRKKYTGPYKYLGQYDIYKYAQELLAERNLLKDKHKVYEKFEVVKEDYLENMNLDEVKKVRYLGFDFTAIKENLQVGEVFGTPDKELFPLANEIRYEYDYGAAWNIKITKMDSYNDLLKTNKITKEKLETAKQSVINNYRPICIYATGVGVVDDAGSLASFIEMVTEINESHHEEVLQTKAWLESMGYKKTLGNVFKIL